MGLNAELESRYWMDKLTHVLYRIDTSRGGNEPHVQWSSNDGVNWQYSSEYPSLSKFREEIGRGNLVMMFVAKPADLAGMDTVMQTCNKIVEASAIGKGQPGASKRDSGIKEGKLEAAKMILGICEMVLARAVEKKEDGTVSPVESVTGHNSEEQDEQVGVG